MRDSIKYITQNINDIIKNITEKINVNNPDNGADARQYSTISRHKKPMNPEIKQHRRSQKIYLLIELMRYFFKYVNESLKGIVYKHPTIKMPIPILFDSSVTIA